MSAPTESDDVRALLGSIREIIREVGSERDALLRRWGVSEERPLFGWSADNLAAYVALRRHDLRTLQERLAPWALSTLGRAESRVMPTLAALEHVLATLAGEQPTPASPPPSARAFELGSKLLERAERSLFGPPRKTRQTRIMVTLDSEVAADRKQLERLIERGMDVARINCAHDDPAAWRAMIANVREASARVGWDCKVFVDIAGPKLRVESVLAPDDYRLVEGTKVLLRDSPPDPGLPYPVQAQVSIPEVLAALEVGQPVFIDDGKTECLARECIRDGKIVEVVRGSAKGQRLKADKSVNLPASAFSIPALTPKDIEDLGIIAREVDALQYSFVQSGQDVEALQHQLAKLELSRSWPALILKIETARAVRALPELIVRAGVRQPVGVMIARGDLAVELGFERMAEMQEEILWIAEAAHTPVIWATQVLERMIKTGLPTRAEVSDAAMAGRAECVMLNKGPYQLHAIEVLDDILRRMQAHHHKKRARLRALRSF